MYRERVKVSGSRYEIVVKEMRVKIQRTVKLLNNRVKLIVANSMYNLYA